MGCCGKICTAIFAIFTCLITITTMGFTGYYTKPHCGKDNPCADGMAEICPGAYALSSVTVNGYSLSLGFQCPWRVPTYVIGLISLSLVQILIVMVFVAMRGASLKCPMYIVGLLAIVLILTSTGLMVKDLVEGLKYYADNIKGAGVALFNPVGYIVNIALMAMSFLSTAFLLCCASGLSKNNGGTVQRMSASASAKISNAHSIQPSNYQSHANTPNIIPNGHDTSMGHSTNQGLVTHGHNTSMGYSANHGLNTSIGYSANRGGMSHGQNMNIGYSANRGHNPGYNQNDHSNMQMHNYSRRR